MDCEIVDSSENIFYNQAASLSLTSRWNENGGGCAVSPDCDDELDSCFGQADHSVVFNGTLGGGEEDKSPSDDENGNPNGRGERGRDESVASERDSAIYMSAVVAHDSDSGPGSASSYSDDGMVLNQREIERVDDDGVGVREDYFGYSSSVGSGSGPGSGSGSEGVSENRSETDEEVGVEEEVEEEVGDEVGNGSWLRRRRLSPGHSLSVALRKFCVEHGVEIERRKRW